MPISALCLIQRRNPSELPAPIQAAGGRSLDDAWLIPTGLSFALAPEALAQGARTLLGEALDEHDDERGLFIIPDVAKPSARTYAGVVEEIGDVGVWAPLAAAGLAGGLDALLGGMLGQMPPDFLATAAATMRDNPEAVAQASSQLQHLMRNPDQLSGLTDMLRGAGIDIHSNDLQRLAADMARDPSQLAKLAEQLFGGSDEGEDEDEDDERDPPAR